MRGTRLELADCGMPLLAGTAFLVAAGTVESDSVCQAVAECDAGTTFEATPPTSNTDRVCAGAKKCKKSEYVHTQT